MANFIAKKLDLSQINNGSQYNNGDGLQAETINAVVEGCAYAQEVAENIEQYNKGQIEEVFAPLEVKVNEAIGLTKGLYGALIEKGIFAVAEDVVINQQFQTTGGSELANYKIVDNSYATVKEIIGDTKFMYKDSVQGDIYMNFKISGIRSTSLDKTKESVMLLPSEIELAKWDYIKDGQLVKQTKFITVDKLSSYQMEYNDEYGVYYGSIYIDPNNYGASGITNIISGKQIPTAYMSTTSENMGIYMLNDGSQIIVWFRDSLYQDQYQDINGVNAFIKGLKVAYQLASPISTTPITFSNTYIVWDKGKEEIRSNSFVWSASPTIKNDYIVLVGG